MQTATKPNDPTLVHIHKDGGFSLTGDAIPMFRVISLRGTIALHRKCGMIPTRGVTITKMLAMAGQITGETYKRGQHERAEADLQLWIDAAKAAMPVQDDRA